MLDNFQEEMSNKLRIAISELEKKAIEREVLARLMVLAVVSKTHLFLIGDPGVGKSYLIKKIVNLVPGVKYFEHLMTYSTQAEEILGVTYTDANGNTKYNLKDSIVEANVVFLDEIMKSKSVILNALLGILGKDRIFHMKGGNGGVVETQVMTAFGASNEFEQSSDLGALADRFHMRYEPSRIKTKEGFRRFMLGDFDKSNNFSVFLTKEEINYLCLCAKDVEIPEYILDLFAILKSQFSSAKLKASDRKIEDSRDIMKVCAYCNNRNYLDVSDLFIFTHTMWLNFSERSRVKDLFTNTIFSSKKNYINKIENGEDLLHKQESYIGAEIGDIFHKRVSLNPDFIVNNFPTWRLSVENLYNNFIETKRIFTGLLQKFDEIKRIEDTVRDNIFLVDLLEEENLMIPNPYERPFDEEMIKRCENNIFRCNLGLKQTMHFLQGCKRPEDYLDWRTIA